MIKVNIKATNIDLSDPIREYVYKKIDALKKFVHDDEEVMVDIEVGKTTHHHHSGDIFRAEINVYAPTRAYRAVAETVDLYAAIDLMQNEILNEMRTEKKKRLHFIKKTGQRIKNFIRRFYR